MITATDVEDIIDTYDLSKKKRRKISYIVCKELHEVGFPNFDFLYRRISQLVDTFTSDYGAKFTNLDQQIGGDSRFLLHDRFKVDEEKIAEGRIDNITINDAVRLISADLDQPQKAVLDFLLQGLGQREVEISPEMLRADLPAISLRLEQMIRFYEKDGKLLIPRKPIVDIKWNPAFWVKFGMRNFNGTPAKFYWENIDVYGGFKTRSALEGFDPGLASALRRYGQFDQCIPALPIGAQKRKFAEAEVTEIKRLYDKHRGNVRAMMNSLRFSVGRKTLVRCIKEQGLELRSTRSPPQLPFQEQERIHRAYDDYGKSAYKAAKHLPYSADTIRRYWKDLGLEVLRPGRCPSQELPNSKIQAILKSYEICEGSARAASRELGHSKRTILKHWREAGYTILAKGSNQNKKYFSPNHQNTVPYNTPTPALNEMEIYATYPTLK